MDNALNQLFGVVDSSTYNDEIKSKLTHDIDAFYCLYHLSEELLEKGEIEKAILCLEAICQSRYCFTKANIEPNVRLRVAHLYLAYTKNLMASKHHLLKGVNIEIYLIILKGLFLIIILFNKVKCYFTR